MRIEQMHWAFGIIGIIVLIFIFRYFFGQRLKVKVYDKEVLQETIKNFGKEWKGGAILSMKRGIALHGDAIVSYRWEEKDKFICYIIYIETEEMMNSFEAATEEAEKLEIEHQVERDSGGKPKCLELKSPGIDGIIDVLEKYFFPFNPKNRRPIRVTVRGLSKRQSVSTKKFQEKRIREEQ